MSDDIAKLLHKFDVLTESSVTPATLSKGLNKQQKSVPQLPALFKPKKISVLQNPKDPQHPMKGYAVGTSESKKLAMTAEDLLGTVSKKLGDYLQDVSQEIKNDPELLAKVADGNDLLKPAVKTLVTHDGHEIKIHGNEDDGFRITIKNRPLKSQFDNLDEAVMACEMYCHRRKQSDLAQDYMEES